MKTSKYTICLLATLLLGLPASPQSLSGKCMDSDCILRLLEDPDARDVQKLKGWIEMDSAMATSTIANSVIRARVQRMISCIYYDKSQFNRSIYWAGKARVMLRASSSSKQESLLNLAKTFYLMVACYDSLNLHQMQMNMIDSCISVDKETNSNYYNTCLLIADQVAWLYNKGDYRACISYAVLGEGILKQHYHEKDSLHRATSITVYKIQSHIFLGELQTAQQIIQQTLRTHKGLRSIGLLGTLQGLNADLYIKRNMPDSAIAALRIAIRNHKERHYAKGSAECYEILAQVYLNFYQQPDLCLKYNSEALRFAANIDSISIFNTISRAYLKLNRPDIALAYVDKAASVLGVDMKSEDSGIDMLLRFSVEKRAPYAIDMLIAKADVHLAIGKLTNDHRALTESLDYYRRADHLIKAMKNEYGAMDSKLFWRKYSVRLYECAIEASWLLDDKQAAFYFFEKSRAILLQDQVNETTVMKPEELKQMYALQAEINVLRSRLSQTNINDPRYTELQSQVIDLEISRYKLHPKSSVTDFRSTNSRHVFDSFPALATVKRMLHNHQAYVNIFNGDSGVYLLKFMGQKIAFTRVDKKIYECHVKQFQGRFAKANGLQRFIRKMVIYSEFTVQNDI